MIPQFISRIAQLPVGVRKQVILNAYSFYYGRLPNPTFMSRNYGKSLDGDPPINIGVDPDEKDRVCKQYTTIGKIFNCITPKSLGGNNKVSVIGLDDVGMATVFCLLAKEVTDNICMIDMNEEILQGEHLEIQTSAMYLNNPKVTASKDPAVTRDSKVCVVTTGTYKGRDENEAAYVARNSGILRALVPLLVKYSPETIFIVASDPVDVLCYVTWKLSGAPKNRIIGTGTMMDTARFRYFLADKFGVPPHVCHANIIGEHGKNSVPVWSSVSIGGVRLHDLNPRAGTKKDPEMWHEIYKDVVKTEDSIRQLKGSLSWSVALAVSEICQAIFSNSNIVTPVCTFAKGEYNIRDQIYLSLPCVLGKSGVTDIVRQSLTEEECFLLRRGAENIAQMQENSYKILS